MIFLVIFQCILSGIIVVALKGMFLQFGDLPKAWKVSKVNACVWATTFLCTVVLDIEYGLGIGILFSIMLLVWTATHGSLTILGAYANFDLYADISTNLQVRFTYLLDFIKLILLFYLGKRDSWN